ncbi:MAG: YjbQ family protein [Candidatus Lokiarchaeota archaeon]|nr:YjbQ family protein [Candidatus Lokiarchaeota archaeon]MBD3339073.1 YjbQ family protein [Candidatus Lokiarchaeota archaeon]
MIVLEKIKVKTKKREGLTNITSQVENVVKNSGIKKGVCRIFVPHTTAGITINENADPAVAKDISNFLKKLIPKGGDKGYSFQHMEGNADSHIKSSLTGPSLTVLIHNRKLLLGTWQGIMFTEYDGPRTRKVYVQVQGEN